MSESRESSGAAEANELGRSIGGFQLVELLGRGGMGEVYLAEHSSLGRRVAVKIILAELGASTEMRARFLDEARLVAGISHPGLVEIQDLATLEDGRPYLVMEYLEGEPLNRVLRRRGKLPIGEACAIAVELLVGLAAAHARGVVHRDIKPHNLFVIARGQHGAIKILDFGLAKLHGTGTPGHTKTGAILGTPGYMAPEQTIAGRAIDARADIYSVGVVLYEMLAGHPLYRSDDWVELLHLHRTADVPILSEVPSQLFAIVTKALGKNPETRHASASELAELLRWFATRVPAPEISEPRSRVEPTSSQRSSGDDENAQPTRALRPMAPPENAAEEQGLPAPRDEAKAQPTRALRAMPLAANNVADEGAPPAAHDDAKPQPTRALKARPPAADKPAAAGDSQKADARRSRTVGIAVAGIGAVIVASAAISLLSNKESGPRAVELPATDAATDAAMDATAIAIVTPTVDAGAPSTTIEPQKARDAGLADAPTAQRVNVVTRVDAGTRRADAAMRESIATETPVSGSASEATGSADAEGDKKPTYFLSYDIPTKTAWDFHARIGFAQALARKVFDDARLVHIGGWGLEPKGTFDLTTTAYVAYTFRSPSRSARGTRLKGQTWTCLVYVTVRGTGIQVMANDSECNEPFFTPRCSGRELWKIALDRGAEDGRVAALHLYPDPEAGSHLWKLTPDEHYDIHDAECAR